MFLCYNSSAYILLREGIMKNSCSIASSCCKSLLGFLILIIASLFLLCLVSIFQQLRPFPDVLNIKSEGTNSVNEVDAALAFIASIATVALAYIAYYQVSPIKNTLKMEFIRHLDEQWISKEITEVRCELWEIYWNELKKTHGHKELAIDKVKTYVNDLYINSIKEPSTSIKYNKNDKEGDQEKNIERFFRYLNFMDVMGTIYIYKNSGVLEEKDIKILYAGRLKRYLDFYQTYFDHCYREKRPKPNAMLLLEEWKDNPP